MVELYITLPSRSSHHTVAPLGARFVSAFKKGRVQDLTLNDTLAGTYPMTELISKPVVKLPRKRQTLLFADHEAFAANTDFLVSDKLYVDPLPPTVTATDVIDLLRSCEPVE